MTIAIAVREERSVLDLVLGSLLATFVGEPTNDCQPRVGDEDYHLMDVCDELLEEAPAYSATFRSSLSPLPASQQVMVYQVESRWFVRIAGYNWDANGAVRTSRNDIAILSDDAELLVSQLTSETFERLRGLHYYGSPDQVCMDGANMEIAMASAGRRYAVSQHSCAGQSEIFEIAASFRDLALKYDPSFQGLLAGLQNSPSAP